jgi:ABC-type bacteriocin/lantibiotic exporter with double-glycine peptidase domain
LNLVRGAPLLVLQVTLVIGGCYTGAARTVSPADLGRDPGWRIVPGVPFVEQRAENDCGAAALAMVLRYWGLPVRLEAITPGQPRHAERGLRAGELRDFARGRGLEAFVVQGQLTDLWAEIERARPVIVGLGKPYGDERLAHYEVVVGLHRQRRRILTLDPARGWRENSLEAFAAEWAPAQQLLLVVFRLAGR